MQTAQHKQTLANAVKDVVSHKGESAAFPLRPGGVRDNGVRLAVVRIISPGIRL